MNLKLAKGIRIEKLLEYDFERRYQEKSGLIYKYVYGCIEVLVDKRTIDRSKTNHIALSIALSITSPQRLALLNDSFSDKDFYKLLELYKNEIIVKEETNE